MSLGLDHIEFRPMSCRHVTPHEISSCGLVLIRADNLRMAASCHTTPDRKWCHLELLSSCCGAVLVLENPLVARKDAKANYYLCGHCGEIVVPSSLEKHANLQPYGQGHKATLASWVDLIVAHEVERSLVTIELTARLEEWAAQVRATKVMHSSLRWLGVKPRFTKSFLKLCQHASGDL